MKLLHLTVSSALVSAILRTSSSQPETADLSKEAIGQWAYLRYLDRQVSGIAGTAGDDWKMGKQLALLEYHLKNLKQLNRLPQNRLRSPGWG